MSVVGGLLKLGNAAARAGGRYVELAGRVGRSAARAAPGARAARAQTGQRLLASRLLRDAAPPGAPVRATLNRLDDAKDIQELGQDLQTLMQMQALSPNLVRSVTAGTSFPGFSNPAKLLTWFRQGGREALKRAPESRVYQEMAGAEDAATSALDRARALTGRRQGRMLERRERITDLRGRRRRETDVDFASRPDDTTVQDFTTEVEDTVRGDAALARGEAQRAAMREMQDMPPSVRDLPANLQGVDRLPMRRLLRELQDSDENIKKALRSGKKIREVVPDQSAPGFVRVRFAGGSEVQVDLGSPAVRATETGGRFHTQIETALKGFGYPIEEGVGRSVAAGATGFDTGSGVLSGYMSRLRNKPVSTAANTLTGVGGAALAADYIGDQFSSSMDGEMSTQDVTEQQRAVMLRALQGARYTQTMAANEARLAAIEPDLYNGMLAGRRVPAGSRVYGAPKRTDEMMQILDAMSMGRFQQSLGTMNLGY